MQQDSPIESVALLTEYLSALPRPREFHVGVDRIRVLIAGGVPSPIADFLKRLDEKHHLIAAETTTEFEVQLVASTRLFGEASLEARTETRLILMLAALEALFLRNSQEPLAQNIGERIAFLIESTAEKRRSIIDLIREVYKIRSGFVHHNIEIGEDMDALGRFGAVGWKALCRAVALSSQFKTRFEFLDKLEDLKLS